jgi:hydrogenase-4 component E
MSVIPMSEGVFVQLLSLTTGAVLLTAVLVLWRRELAVVIRVFAVQGVALAGLVAVLALEEASAELGAVAVGVLVLRGGLLPYLLHRALTAAGPERREIRPVVNVSASLLVAAALTLLALAVSQPLVALAPSPATTAIPVGVAVVLIGFFVLVTRRRALSQLIGFLLMDNGITAVGFLTTAGVGPVVELGVSLDVLLAVLVLGVLTGRMREAFGDTDLDELRELHD